MTRIRQCAVHLFVINIHLGNSKCEMYDEVCVQGKRDVSAELKITTEEITH